MTEDSNLPPPLPPRLDWFVHTQMGQLAQDGVPTWFHGAISREAAENLLEPQPLGSFLIRVSHSHVGYTLSYKAHGCCRHFMVKLLDDGSIVIPGERVTHASLDALVTFHQQEPVQPYGELLTQPCGQEDPANVDYEDLFLYSSALAEEATSLVHDPSEHQGLSPCLRSAPGKAFPHPALLHWPKERKPSADMDRTSPENATSSCPKKAPLGDTRQKLWKNLKTLPQMGKRVQKQLKSHLEAMSLLLDTQVSTVTHGSGAGASSHQDADPSTHPSGGAQAPHSSPRDRNALSREVLRSLSWSGVSPGDGGLHQEVGRSPSLQVSMQKMKGLAEPQEDYLPEEYRPPPPFAPGYC